MRKSEITEKRRSESKELRDKAEFLKDMIEDLFMAKDHVSDLANEYEVRLEKTGDTGGLWSEYVEAKKEVGQFKEDIIEKIKKF